MNVLDENAPRHQCQELRSAGLKFQQIGKGIGRSKMQDSEIVVFLLRLSRPTFFSLDADFYRRPLCHKRYAIVWLDVHETQMAKFCLRLLRHPELDTKAKRMGRVIRVAPSGIWFWQVKVAEQEHRDWEQ